MPLVINKLFISCKMVNVYEGKNLYKQPNYIHITHHKEKHGQISSLDSWICLLHYISLYFPNSQRNMYQCHKKKKIYILLPLTNIFCANTISMITGLSQIFLSFYESDSNPKYDFPKADTKESWWQNQQESSKTKCSIYEIFSPHCHPIRA